MHLFGRRALGLDLSFSFTFTYARPSRARMRRTYQLRRARATGGHGFGLSSAVSKYVVAAMFGEESHRSAEVGIFLQDPSDATKCAGLKQVIKFERSTLFGAFRGMIYGQREVFDDKFKTLSKSMAENKGWGGSMGSLTLFAYPDSAVHFLDDALGLQNALSILDGAKPWTRIYRNNQRNFGGLASFVPGAAGIYFSFHNAFTLVAMAMEALVEKAITFESYESFLLPDIGKAHFEAHAVVLHVTEGQFAMVPP